MSPVRIAILLLVLSTQVSRAGVVLIPDATLEAGLREALAKPTGDINSADMEGLVELTIKRTSHSTPPIRSLAGMEWAMNLTRLALIGHPGGGLLDLALLPELQLRLPKLAHLNLSYNRLREEHLHYFSDGLVELNLSENRLSNPVFPQSLRGLLSLDLSNNDVTNPVIPDHS